MPLIRRLMDWGNRTGDSVSAQEPRIAEDRHIAAHLFFAAQNEVIRGKITIAQVKNYLGMTAEEQAQYDALVALAPGADAGKALFVEAIHSVIILAESRVPGYETPANVRTKLGL